MKYSDKKNRQRLYLYTHISYISYTYPIHITLVVPSRQCLFTYLRLHIDMEVTLNWKEACIYMYINTYLIHTCITVITDHAFRCEYSSITKASSNAIGIHAYLPVHAIPVMYIKMFKGNLDNQEGSISVNDHISPVGCKSLPQRFQESMLIT